MYYRLDEDKTLKWLQKKVLIAFTRGVDKLHLRMQTVRSMVNIDFVQVVNTAEILKNNALAGKRKGLSSSFTAPDAVVTKKQSSAAAKDRARGDGICWRSRYLFLTGFVCVHSGYGEIFRYHLRVCCFRMGFKTAKNTQVSEHSIAHRHHQSRAVSRGYSV